MFRRRRRRLLLFFFFFFFLFFFFFFFFYWLVSLYVPQPRRLFVLARLWKFPLAPPGAPTPTTTRETSSRERGKKWPVILSTNGGFHAIGRDLLHAANLRHGTDGFTSPPKEGILRIFSPDSNPRTWVPEASMLPQTTEVALTMFTSCLVFVSNSLPYSKERRHVYELCEQGAENSSCV
jgi:hypothetical protein